MLQLAGGNPRHKYRLEEVISQQPCGEGLEVVMDEKLDLSWQYQKQAHPGLHPKQCGQQVKVGDSVPLLCPCETPPGTAHTAWDPRHKEDTDLF